MSTVNSTVPAAVSAAPVALPSLNNTLGAAFIGLIISAVLYGVTALQCVRFYEKSAKDSIYLKSIVGFLWVLDTLHLVFTSHAMYTYLVTDFFNPEGIAGMVWSLSTMIIVSTLSNCLVQMCYLHRVWIISKRKTLLIVIPAIVTLFSTSLGFFVGIKSYSFKEILQLDGLKWALNVAFSTAIVSDLWIVISLCILLTKNRTGFKSTDKKINILMAYIINTGALTAITAICVVATFAAMPQNYIFIAFFESYSKLFFNALLAMLNARSKLSKSADGLSSLRKENGKDGKVIDLYRLSPRPGGASRTHQDQSSSFEEEADSGMGKVYTSTAYSDFAGSTKCDELKSTGTVITVV